MKSLSLLSHQGSSLCGDGQLYQKHTNTFSTGSYHFLVLCGTMFPYPWEDAVGLIRNKKMIMETTQNHFLFQDSLDFPSSSPAVELWEYVDSCFLLYLHT